MIGGLPSSARTVTLVCSILVALGAGTNYVYSAYAPQLGRQLQISHTQLNIVGLAGNIGVYSTGPLWGHFVDTRGPRICFVNGVLLLFFGYTGIRLFYDGYIPIFSDNTPHPRPTLTPGLILLAIFSYCTGAGGNAGLTASMNCTAKSFRDRSRATVTGLVASGFGLSAFLFSTLAHTVFPGNTSSFLLLLSIGTSLPMLLGLIFIRPVLYPEDAPHDADDDLTQIENPGSPLRQFTDAEPDIVHESLYEREDTASTPFLPDRSRSRSRISSEHIVYAPHSSSPVVENSMVAESTPHPRGHLNRTESGGSEIMGTSKSLALRIDIYGRALFESGDFWLLFTVVSLLSGTGLMYINNVGAISQALSAFHNPQWDDTEAAKLQAQQVSVVSMANCLGRILIGLTADFFKNRYSFPRPYHLVFISSVFILSQLMVINTDDTSQLWKASATVGLAYGAMFGLCPIISLEWFGLAHFSQNWGIVAMSPVIGGNLFSLAFGRNLDAHEAKPSTAFRFRDGLPNDTDRLHQCLEGRQCYVDSVKMTAAACVLALGLSVFAGWRDMQRKKAIASYTLMTRGNGSAGSSRRADGRDAVIWEAEGEQS